MIRLHFPRRCQRLAEVFSRWGSQDVEVKNEGVERMVDAIHHSRGITNRIGPVMKFFVGMARFFGRAPGPSGMDGLRSMKDVPDLYMFENWHKSRELRAGVEMAYAELLRRLYQKDYTNMYELVKHDVEKMWFSQQNQAEGESGADEVVSSGNSDNTEESDNNKRKATKIEELDLSGLKTRVRFLKLYGPGTMAFLTPPEDGSDMKFNRLLERARENRETFAKEMMQRSTLHIDLEAAAVDTKNGIERLDRLTLSCDFNIREGIIGSFLCSSWESVHNDKS